MLNRKKADRRPLEWPPHLEFWYRVKHTLPERIGEADLSTLNSALDVLFGRLREALAQFEQKGDDGRSGAYTALGAFWQFITLFKTPHIEDLRAPILRLQGALAMLDQGLIEPIVKPAQRSGRAPSSHAYAGLKGRAAATVQLLLRIGLAHHDAHQAVANQLVQLGVRATRGKGTVTATTVRNWCGEVSSDVGRSGPAAMAYDSVLASAAEPERLALTKDQAGSFLQALADWIRLFFPELKKNLLNPLS